MDYQYPIRPVDRQPFYGAGVAHRAWSICDQTAPPATYTGQTSYVATTPTFMLRKAGTTTRHILRNFELAQAGVVAANLITVLLMLDNVDRLSGTSGTLITPKNTNSDFVATALTDLTVKANPTAIAAGSGSSFLKAYTAVPLLGNTIKLDCLDGLVMGPTSSVLIYCFATTTGPTLYLNGDVIEEGFTSSLDMGM